MGWRALTQTLASNLSHFWPNFISIVIPYQVLNAKQNFSDFFTQYRIQSNLRKKEGQRAEQLFTGLLRFAMIEIGSGCLTKIKPSNRKLFLARWNYAGPKSDYSPKKLDSNNQCFDLKEEWYSWDSFEFQCSIPSAICSPLRSRKILTTRHDLKGFIPRLWTKLGALFRCIK